MGALQEEGSVNGMLLYKVPMQSSSLIRDRGDCYTSIFQFLRAVKHLADMICPLLLWMLREEHSEGTVVGWLGPDSVEKEQVYSM